MTTPSEGGPIDPVDPTPTPVPEPLPTSAPTDAEIRELAAVISAPQLTFDPLTARKGVVTAIATTATPPTISITISGDTTVIDGVRFWSSYTPQVGQTVTLGKQGSDIWAMGSIVDLPAASDGGGWTTATLGSGFSHNGNSGGTVQYRRVMDNGAWKMQWQGVAARSSGTLLLSAALPAEYRPTAKRPLNAGRDPGGGSNATLVEFNTSGTVDIVSAGQTASPSAGGATSGSTGSASTGSTGSTGSTLTQGTGNAVSGNGADPNHFHFDFAAHSHSISTSGSHTHSISSASHGHTVLAPVWISFNGLEYFL